jgi:CelD/BcsL family acetyltransferase involved in cellulose biosynthesis
MATPPATSVSVTVEPFPGIPALAALWADLEIRADHNFYLTWHWIGALLAEAGIEPRVAIARTGGRVVGLGLLQARRETRHRGLLKIGKLYLNETGDPEQDITCIEYNGFLVDAAQGETVERQMLAHIALTPPAELGLPAWDEFRLGGVPARYQALAAATGLRLHLVGQRPTAIVDVAAIRGAGKGYLDSLSANTRYQARRALKLYGQRGPVTLDAAATVEEAYGFLDGMAALHQPYWLARGSRGAFGYPFLVAFHKRVIAGALPKGEVELLRIRAGDRPIGFLYNFVHRGRVGTYLSGFAYEEDAKLKPGYVAYALCIDRHLALGTQVVDFLAGENRYKMSLGRRAGDIVHFDLQRPRLKLRVEDAARNLRNRYLRKDAAVSEVDESA